MSQFVSLPRIHRAIINLAEWKETVHGNQVSHLWPWFAAKWKGVSISGNETSEWTEMVERDDQVFWDRFLRVKDTEMPYYDPIKKMWYKHDAYHHNVATQRKNTFVGKWKGAKWEKKGEVELWAFNPNHIKILQDNALSVKGKLSKVPLYDLVAWLYRDESFEDDISIKDVVNIFYKEFNITDDEKKQLFNESSFDSAGESNFFSDHHAAREFVQDMIEKGGDFDLSDSLAYISLNNRSHTVERKDVTNLLLHGRKQIILQGPPGTSKTYFARQVAAEVLGADDDVISNPDSCSDFLSERQFSTNSEEQLKAGAWDIIQFHPGYTYEDFIRGIRAVVPEGGGTPVFKEENRVFGDLAKLAATIGKPVVLIIDEINRGDLSKVLGELVYALEYRGTSVRTPYSVDGDSSIEVPPNLYLIATMNTADRSIALIDYAIRRRFDFVEMKPDRQLLSEYLDGRASTRAMAGRVLELYDSIEDILKDDSDHAVGHAYFMAETPDDLARQFVFQVMPLLAEYQKEGILAEGIGVTIDNWPGGTIPLTHPKPFALVQEFSGWIGGGDSTMDLGSTEEQTESDDEPIIEDGDSE